MFLRSFGQQKDSKARRPRVCISEVAAEEQTWAEQKHFNSVNWGMGWRRHPGKDGTFPTDKPHHYSELLPVMASV